MLSAAVHATCRSVLRQRQLFKGSPSESGAECSRVSENYDQEVNIHAEQVVATGQLSHGKKVYVAVNLNLGFT